MSSFLYIAVSNAEHVLPRGIRKVQGGPLGSIDEVHQICTMFRQIGVATMFEEASADRFHSAAMQSASLYWFELERQPDDNKVTSFAKPLFDAIVSGYWNAAEAIASASRSTWNADREYEDDFLYVWFLVQHAILRAPAQDVEPLLERYDEVLEGAVDLRYDICRALLAADPAAFHSTLESLLDERQQKVDALIKNDTIGPDAATWIRHFALEGLALLKIADRLGITTGKNYLHCPELARSDSPFMFDRNAWGQVSIQPVRRP